MDNFSKCILLICHNFSEMYFKFFKTLFRRVLLLDLEYVWDLVLKEFYHWPVFLKFNMGTCYSSLSLNYESKYVLFNIQITRNFY